MSDALLISVPSASLRVNSAQDELRPKVESLDEVGPVEPWNGLAESLSFDELRTNGSAT